MDFLSVIILTVVNIFVCLSLPKLLSLLLRTKQESSSSSVGAREMEEYPVRTPELTLSHENA
jgi:hypothetical protein